MTTALTATPLPAGAVALTITGAPAGDVTLSRIDRNGYAQVRRTAGVDLTTGAVRTVTDWEAALAGPVRYLVLDASGEQTFATTSITLTEPRPQLRRVYRPAIGGPLEAVVAMTESQPLAASEHHVVGRADTVFTTYRLGLRTGTITYSGTERPAVDAIRDVYADGQVCLLRLPDHDGVDVFHLGLAVSPTAGDIGADGRQEWTTTVTFAEVLPAAGDTLAPWTLADVAATFSTMAAVGLVYATIDDLAANHPVAAP